MEADVGHVVSVHVGKIAPLGVRGIKSGFVKHAVAGPVRVGALGLDGDEHANLDVHGGDEMAVYAYPATHYPLWQQEYPAHAALFVPGGVGENLAVAGLDETTVCIGDVHEIGSTQLQICQPRQPCATFAARFGDSALPKAMVRNGRAGWYYRVLQTGAICAGDAVRLLDRPNPDWPFARFLALTYDKRAALALRREAAALPGLARHWQRAFS